jgi:hypothetical protein
MRKVISKKGQEEIVGFVVIMVIVAVVIVILLWFMLVNPSESAVENFEVESFIETTLQYTSNCENQVEFLSVQGLVIACEEEEKCLDGKNSCTVLNKTLTDIIGSSWPVSEQSAIKGYKLNVYVNEEESLLLLKGNETTNYKGAFQDFARAGSDYKVSLNIYY